MGQDRVLRELYLVYKSNAKSRGHTFDMDFLEAKPLFLGDCFYCGISPSATKKVWDSKDRLVVTVKWNGMDRIDNSLGYEPDNCVSCCKRCNRMKMDQTLEEFFARVFRIAHIHKLADQ